MQYITQANIKNLIQTVKEEIDQIELDHSDSLSIMKRFETFTVALNQISQTPSEIVDIENNVPVYLTDKQNLKRAKSIEELNESLERLYGHFKLIVKETFILHTHNANNPSVRKNLSLESKFQVIKLSYIYTSFYYCLICFN